MDIKPEVVERLKKLEEKYAAMGQDMVSYLDGLLYSDYLTYWDYIHLDTLLSLQNPKTQFPDEQIFIIYHQITELYFKLSLLEFEQMAAQEKPEVNHLVKHVTRINRYFENLIHSFDIMVDGMEQQQFLKFRMALLPASGFQSAQYRMVEIAATDFYNLLSAEAKEKLEEQNEISYEEMIKNIYWGAGATELATGKKTLTLRQFEKKYFNQLIKLAHQYKNNNLWQLYLKLSEEDRLNQKIIQAMRQLDVNVNINWPLSHYKSAVRYLQRDPEDIKATGGTNWQKYLPPRFQKRIFYPKLWTPEEIVNWGKGWVHQVLNIPTEIFHPK